MWTFVVEHTNGVPTHAKSRIVVLGNLDRHEWGKSICLSPVIFIPMIRFLTALAVQNGHTLKQGDCKFAFIQTTLPDNELTIIKPPIGCPSSRGTYWKLYKSLYGHHCTSHHWYDMLCCILQSPQIGLQPWAHEPCVFVGTPLPGKPPIYVAIYADDIIYLSVDDEVEHFFCMALSHKLKVDFIVDAELYIRIKFDWLKSPDGSTACRLSQEGYAATIVEEMGLSSATKCPLMTPFWSALPVDAIPHEEMSLEDRAPLIAKMQSWMGMLNWLQQCTCPDLSTIISLLASYMNCPSLGHLEAVQTCG